MTVTEALSRAETSASTVIRRSLRQRLGAAASWRVLGAVAWGRLQGEPWRSLGPAADERERLSRRQAGDLVLLDRAITAVAGAQVAMELAREAVMAGALPFLDALIPSLDLVRGAQTLIDQFFNAEGNLFQENQNTFHFEVSRCHFVELLKRVEAAHLAPLFCEADRAFFDSGARPLALRRTHTLAEGGASCDFHFTLK